MANKKKIDFEETELTERDKHIGRKPMGKVIVEVRDDETVRRDTLKESIRIQRLAIRKAKADIRTAKLRIARAKLDYKISKRG